MMARSYPTWIHPLQSSGSSNQYSNHGEKTAKCWCITALPNWTLAGQYPGKKGHYEAHLCSQGWSGLSWGDAERAFSAWADDSRDELSRLNYKDIQHIDKDLFDVICKHFLINLHKSSVGTGGSFYSYCENEKFNMGEDPVQTSPGKTKTQSFLIPDRKGMITDSRWWVSSGVTEEGETPPAFLKPSTRCWQS